MRDKLKSEKQTRLPNKFVTLDLLIQKQSIQAALHEHLCWHELLANGRRPNFGVTVLEKTD